MNWYLLQTKYRQEANAENALLVQGYQAYLPLALCDRRKATKSRNITEPLYPTYLFVAMNEGQDDFHPIKRTPGVLKIVTFTESPAVVPPMIIDELKAHENVQGIHTTQHDYQAGDRVRLRGGPFKGFEAMVTGTSETRVFALMQVMGDQRLKLDYREIEPIT